MFQCSAETRMTKVTHKRKHFIESLFTVLEGESTIITVGDNAVGMVQEQ